jgi:hypothetical protein
MRRSYPRQEASFGYTLFEVLLSMTLITVVLLLVAQAVQTHLRLLDVSRMEVEEAQIARAVLGAIRRDLRNVIAQREQSDALDPAMTGTLDALLEEEEGETSEASEEAASGSVEETSLVGTTPGIYGESNWIQIDTVRVPRGELFLAESTIAPTSTGLADRVGDAKTVLYYMLEETETADSDQAFLEDPTALEIRRGLVRRELDRRVTQYAVEQGLDVNFQQYDQPISPEIAEIEFQYYDGQEWLAEWDTEEEGALPTAVRAAISIWRKDRESSRLMNAFDDGMEPEDEVITFSLAVAIPVEADAASEEEATSSDVPESP